jgi:dihydroneopterin aldolase
MAVQWRVGVTDAERAAPQRLLLTIEMDLDFGAAAKNDDLTQTIDYFAVSERLRHWGQGKNWKLIERLAAEAAELILAEFGPAQVSVEVKKFVLADTGYVSAKIVRPKPALP